ncbi:MAG: hypothetical protein NW208_07600 [Bryobacter sp.]|nr:hypothetical protein [Bryobacter sp.]
MTRAQEELKRIEQLANVGAVSRLRLEEARSAVADEQDQEILNRLLYGKVGVENLTPGQTNTLVEAAARRIDRTARAYESQVRLVREGVIPPSRVEELEKELAARRLTLQLAENRARVFEELLAMAEAEEEFLLPEVQREPSPDVQYFLGSGALRESHFAYVSAAFERQFGTPLPVSAKGQTALHTSFGFDHSGRVDVAVHPDQPEGLWLRETLEKLKVPYIALRRARPGKSTGPHIHIGPPSTRLRSPDMAAGGN